MRTAADQDAHGRSIALMKFLATVAKRSGVAEHTYVVGGAVRNYLINQPIKDADLVIDSVRAGQDSAWFAKQVAKAIPVKTNLTVNNYGVSILSVSPDWVLDGYVMTGPKGTGETIEIANARKESYGGAEGKGYKPHLVEPATIEEDLVRREFTFNTMLWRLLDLEHGPERAEVLDLLGRGRRDLDAMELRTPVDPDKTFGDDPTRMLRAIKFVAKYGFKIPPDVAASIRKNAHKLRQMPQNAVWSILHNDILGGPNPRRNIKLMHDLGLGDVIKQMLVESQDFAASVATSLTTAEIPLLFDLIDLGWVVQTPLSFLTKPEQERLREVLLHHADDPSFAKGFMAALAKPPIDQPKFFVLFPIPMNQRRLVRELARQTLLEEPSLVNDPTRLDQLLSDKLQARFGEPTPAAKIATKFLSGV